MRFFVLFSKFHVFLLVLYGGDVKIISTCLSMLFMVIKQSSLYILFNSINFMFSFLFLTYFSILIKLQFYYPNLNFKRWNFNVLFIIIFHNVCSFHYFPIPPTIRTITHNVCIFFVIFVCYIFAITFWTNTI